MITFQDNLKTYKIVYKYAGIRQLYSQNIRAESAQIAEHILRNNSAASCSVYPLEKVISVTEWK